MNTNLCCSNCFKDRWLTKSISTGGEKNSNCSFCQKQNTICIAPEKLAYLFQPFLELYEETTPEKGVPLWELLFKDWLLFDSLKPETCSELLKTILIDYNILEKYFLKRDSIEDQLSKWQVFRDELKHVNRYFCANLPDQEPLEAMFSFLTQKISQPSLFYRARISNNSDGFKIEKMGKPPENKVGNGRANPIGISYLYTASDYETSIAEIRPHVGDYVCVCEFETKKDFVLVDLRNPRETLSPFDVLEREEELETVVDNIEYLNKLGEELSKPVIPREANLEYLSTQYICELIKHLKYDGVIYKSSVGNGDNYAIFDEKYLLGKKTDIYRILRNDYKSQLYKK